MRNDSAEILSVPVPVLIKTYLKYIVKTGFSLFLKSVKTLRARITNPRDRADKKKLKAFCILKWHSSCLQKNINNQNA